MCWIHCILTARADTGLTGFSTRARAMFVEFLSVFVVAGQTMLKLVPITIAFGIVFAVPTHWSACNPGNPWWRKREIVTDILYWFLIPMLARFVRIGLMVLGAAWLFNIDGVEALMAV